MRARHLTPWLLLTLVGCAGINRGCSSCWASAVGADWVVVQMDQMGRPYRCWELQNTSIDNEEHSDGIYWKENTSNNLVHISGHYNRVQVTNGNWETAFDELGLTRETCNLIRQRRFDPEQGVYIIPQRK